MARLNSRTRISRSVRRQLPDHIRPRVSRRHRGNLHAQIAVRVAEVFLARNNAIGCQGLYRQDIEVPTAPQLRIEGKLNLLPVCDLADGLALFVQAGTLQIPEVADIVRRVVDTLETERR